MRDCSFPSTSDSARGAAHPRKRVAAFPATFSASLLALSLLAAALFQGCAGSGAGPYPAPTAKNVASAERHGQVTTLATLKVGRKLYIGRCSSCHGLKDPASLAPADWPEMVGRMADNAKINPDQQRAITQYLVSVSALARDTTAAPGPAHPDSSASVR
jgi:mono/diheme cytochrome c family protein